MRTIINRFYKYFNFFWEINEGDFYIIPKGIEGPYCPNCRGDLEFPSEVKEKYSASTNWAGRYSEYKGIMMCNYCRKKHKLLKTINQYKNLVVTAYAVTIRSKAEVFSLDEPPTQLKTRDENERFFLSSKIGQDKSGRTMGVIHMGEKLKDQDEEDYAQIFIDFRNEEVRSHSTNKFPGRIIKKIRVKYPKSEVKIDYKRKQKRK